MKIKLRILHGKLQDKKGKSVGADLEVRGPRFVIGNATDCSMRCRSRTVSSHHCEILVSDDEVMVRDLYSENGTFVNDVKVDHESPLAAGDHLKVGRLEFEVVIDKTAPSPSSQEATGGEKSDPVSDFVSDMLVEADEEERARRLEDPEARQFQLGESAADDGTPSGPEDESDDATKKKKGPPPKKPPGKLPPPPPFTADNTVAAAEETLKKLFTKGKK